MGKPEAVTAALDAETLADLRRLAEHMDCSIDHLVTTAVLRFVNEEIGAITPDGFAHPPMPPRDPSLDWDAIDKARASFSAWLKEGEDAIERGDIISHEDVMAEMRERYAKRRAACGSSGQRPRGVTSTGSPIPTPTTTLASHWA